MKSKIKQDFPVFESNFGLIYLDSTATSLKPKKVIDKITEYYSKYPANIFRGVYKISEKATVEFEETRNLTAEFINAASIKEIIFTRNTTESINLIAYSLGRKIINEGDEIVVTIMEHHSNFVPWQVLAGEVGASLKIINIDDNGYLDIKDKVKTQNSKVKNTSQKLNLNGVITNKTKILAITHVSNVLGTINPIKEIIKAAKSINPDIITIVDAAQSVPHMRIDVQDLGCDFLAFSSHKMLGPTGVGILWGRQKRLEDMYPFLYGGEMISEVFIDKTTFKEPPYKFEAGTPAIGEVIAFKESVKYLKQIGMDKIREHEKKLVDYCLTELKNKFGNKIKVFGPKESEFKGGIVAFNFSNYHPHDVASILDENNICVRAGNHCAMPLHTNLGIGASVRASFYIYNDEEDVDRLIEGLKKVESILK